MGIQNLLPFLENSTRTCHVSEFRGSTVAVDSYCWLHKGARGCAELLAKGQDTDSYVQYCIKYVKMLLHYDIKPIMVFDGRRLPAKLKTEQKRKENKKKALKQANEFIKLGKVEEARRLFNQTVDINPQMALKLMTECRKMNIDCIVAPYESDAQLAFFSLKGIAECVISEDSDLLLFGCKKVLYKMDINGCGQLVEADKIYLSMKMKSDQYTFDKFRFMCILSGCDYVDSLQGIGLKKSLKFLAMTAETNPELFLDRVPRYLNMRHLTVDDQYKEQFLIADATFRHQLVYDPINLKLIPLTDLDVYKDKPQYCKNAGDMLDDDVALQLALGNLDPNTLKRIDDWQPALNNPNSIWSRNFKKKSPEKKKLSPTKKLSKTQSLDVALSIKEAENDEYDRKFEKQLEFYKMNRTDSITTTVQEVEKQKSPPKSPIIGGICKNPFAKRISKFNLTNINDKSIVKSRFFNSQPESSLIESKSEKTESLTQITESSSQTSESLSQTTEILSQTSDYLIKTASNQTGNISDTFLLKTRSSLSEDSQASSSSCEITKYNESVCETILTESDNLNNFQKTNNEAILTETHNASKVTEGLLYEISKTETLVSVENIPKEKNSRKRKSEVELFSKFKKTSQKQLSLKDMFSRMS